MASNLGRLCWRWGQRTQHFRHHVVTKDIFRLTVPKREIHLAGAVFGTIKLDMPSLSPTMEKGNIIKWHKKEGDVIAPGDVLCEIETDKAVIAMDTEEEGILAKIITPDNTKDITVGQLIALLVEEGDDWKSVKVPADNTTTTSSSAASASASSADSHGEHGHLIGPSVKRLLQEYNIPASVVTPSGPNGVLLKGDILNYIKEKNMSKVEQKAASPPTPAPIKTKPAPPPAAPITTDYVDIPLSNMRRTIAKRLTESKSTIPHAYASIDSNVGEVTALRKTLAEDGVKVSINDFIIKAVAQALQRVPQVNAIWTNDSPQLASTADISIAVATPNGLITPIVQGAGNLSVDQISKTVKELAGRAKEGKLKPHEFQGGSFSISNLGMFGISEFTAVINLPQMAILAVGTSRKEVSLDGPVSKMTVTISYDSRGISEMDAVCFLEEFRNVMENPHSMLVGTRLDSAAEAFAF